MKRQNSFTIECTRCGQEISLDLTRCPKCGLNLYPDDYGELDEIDDRNGNYLGSSITAILLGWISAAGFIFIVNFFFKELLAYSPYIDIAISSIGVVGVLLGGFVSGFVSSDRSIWQGTVVGLLSIGTNILFEMFWKNMSEGGVTRIGHPITWSLMILGGIVGTRLAYLVLHRGSNYLFPEDEYLLYRDILSRVQRNHEVVERLIAYEREIAPNSNRASWLRNALERWERDNRL